MWGSPTEAGSFTGLSVRVTDAADDALTADADPFDLLVLPALVTSLDPNSASQAITNAYGVRKIVPAYAGNAGQVRNGAGAGPSNVAFDADGIANSATLTANNGNSGTWATVYDQKGTAHFTSTSRPNIVMDALTNRAAKLVPGINFNNKIQNMTTSQTLSISRGSTSPSSPWRARWAGPAPERTRETPPSIPAPLARSSAMEPPAMWD